jgi:phenylacetate-coenzyme A ligase PaaK-like adenylate-forming protein
MVTQTAKSKADELREFLLPLTVSHAVQRSPFYRRRIGELAQSIRTLDDLPKLPLFQKSDMTAHIDEIRTFDTYPDHLMYTSGTTGAPLEVPIYKQESDAYDDFVLPEWHKRLGGDVPLTLAVIRIGHGTHILNRNIPTLPCHINYGLDQFIQMMESTHWLDGRHVRVQILDANVLSMRQITKELLEQGIDPRRFELPTMVLAGWYLPSWERRFFEDTWGALLLERYGVTEVHGDAKWCPECRYYHFDFTVIPEVIDPDTGEVIEEGIGSMVMTGLYPFNQAIPKIRYPVGDLVEIRKTSCRSKERGVRFLSRLKDAVRAPAGSEARYRVFSSDVSEALAPLPDVARKGKTGFLKFKLSTTPELEARIEVELVYPPKLYPSRVTEIREHILNVLKQRSAALGQPDIVFVKPGGIQEITKL